MAGVTAPGLYPAPGRIGWRGCSPFRYSDALSFRMCGRYTLFRLEQLLHRFPWIERPPADAIARYNIAPTQPVLVIPNERADRFDYFNWGLIPPWAKDPSVG